MTPESPLRQRVVVTFDVREIQPTPNPAKEEAGPSRDQIAAEYFSSNRGLRQQLRAELDAAEFDVKECIQDMRNVQANFKQRFSRLQEAIDSHTLKPTG